MFLNKNGISSGDIMNCVMVYWSRYGNNKKLMEYLAKKLREKPTEVQVFKTDEINPTVMPEADVYVFSPPTEAFRIQKNMRRFMKNLRGMEGNKYGIINTHGMKRNWLPSMGKML